MDSLMSLLWSVVTHLIAEQIKDWLPAIASWVTACSVRLLPTDMRKRYSEEWQSYLDELSGSLAKSFAAFGFILAALKINNVLGKLLARSLGAMLYILLAPAIWFISLWSQTTMAVYSGDIFDAGRKKVKVATFVLIGEARIEHRLRNALQAGLPFCEQRFNYYPYILYESYPLLQLLFADSTFAYLPTIAKVVDGHTELKDFVKLVLGIGSFSYL